MPWPSSLPALLSTPPTTKDIFQPLRNRAIIGLNFSFEFFLKTCQKF